MFPTFPQKEKVCSSLQVTPIQYSGVVRVFVRDIDRVVILRVISQVGCLIKDVLVFMKR